MTFGEFVFNLLVVFAAGTLLSFLMVKVVMWFRRRQARGRAFPRSVQKARRAEYNSGRSIVNTIESSYFYATGMYKVTFEHRPWGQGFVVSLKHHSKVWLDPLVVKVDCSDPCSHPITLTQGDRVETHRLNHVELARRRVQEYMETYSR